MQTKLMSVLSDMLVKVQGEIDAALATSLDERNYKQVQTTLREKVIQLELLEEIVEKAF